VLAYAGVSTGYKSGGFSTTVLPDGELDDYEPENLTAFETGVKAQSADHRLTLNASAFYYDFQNLQVVTQGVVTVVDNAAKAEIYGLDVDGLFALSDGLTLSAGVVWLPKREFVEFTTDENLAGNKVTRAPEWSGTTALSYALPWRGLGEFSLRLEYNYRSSYFFTKENQAFASQEGFGLVNMFLRLEAASARWYVFAAGRNLADEPYFNQAFIQTAPGYPANYEVGFGLRY
jgi:iron complex outermembrane receptor protein